jgi:hypothetical protein
MNNRWNSEGIPRDQLKWALTQKTMVLRARRTRQCLICCASSVNEAGLCDICWAVLDEKELELAGKWLSGVGP